MQNVVWDEDTNPMFLVEDDELLVLDSPHMYGFELGDQVQYIFPDRTFVYRVTHVAWEDATDPDNKLTCVTLTRVC